MTWFAIFVNCSFPKPDYYCPMLSWYAVGVDSMGHKQRRIIWTILDTDDQGGP
ncbi:MAG: hypothetical protein ACTSVT_09720 [Candidatus Thorarchaeota archaeon]